MGQANPIACALFPLMILAACGGEAVSVAHERANVVSNHSPREQMNVLLDEACRAALHLLEKNKEFYPFAVAMDPDGKIRHVAGYTGNEMPTSREVSEVLVEGLRRDAKAGKLLASALVQDVRITDSRTGAQTDAIQVALEHESDEPVTCFLPYSLSGEAVSQGEIAAERGQRTVFGPGT